MTKITVDRALIEQAVDAAFSPYCAQDLAILAPALRAALAEPAVEPVAWLIRIGDAPNWSYCETEAESDFYGKQSGMRYEKKPLYTSPPPPAESVKPPGMAVQALAGEIVAALLADEKDGGYDLTAGMFGPAFSVLVRRWAAAEWNSPPAEPATVPLLSDEEIADCIRHLYQDETALRMSMEISIDEFRAIEQLVRRKAGL